MDRMTDRSKPSHARDARDAGGAPGTMAPPRLGASRAKVGLAMRLERLWPLLAPVLWVGVAFACLAWFGAFRASPSWLRIALLVVLGVAALAALARLARYSDPRPAEIDRRLESANALEHQPVSSQADTLPEGADPFARALWEEHRRRLSAGLDRLSGAAPRAGMPERDPWALRTIAPLALVLAFAFSLGSSGGRLGDAFRAPALPESVAARLDAWVTPPDYTGVPPIFLTRDGGAVAPDADRANGPEAVGRGASSIDGPARPDTSGRSDTPERAGTLAREVPAGSILTLRIAEGEGTERVEIVKPDGTVLDLPDTSMVGESGEGGEDGAPAPVRPDNARVFETVLEGDSTVRVRAGGGMREFRFLVVPDLEPTIAWRENEAGEAHEISRTGALTLHYEVADDYPLAGGRAVVEPAAGPGARPLYDAPEIALAMPRLGAGDGPAGEGAQGVEAARLRGVARTARDLTEHPMAGARVDIVLEATDKAGRTARSAPRTLLLPEHAFRKPLARALVEQRRALALDANEAARVVANLDLIMLHAEETIDDTPHFLGLVTARGRIANAWSDDLLREGVDYLWELARAIEDGAVSSAERRLRDAQDALEQALEEGAGDEELQALMDELREAMEEFMAAMAERMRDMPQQAMPLPPDTQFLDQNDLNRMLDNMEEMARSGQREQAQAMLDELRRMTEQLQAGTPQQGEPNEQAAEMQRQMQEMGDLLREQQELMDETFRMENSRPRGMTEMPRPGDQSRPDGQQPPQAGRQPQPGRQGQQQQDQQQGEQQQGEGGQQQAGPQPGEPMSPEEFAEAMEQLRQRQEALQERLQAMQEAMEGMGLEPSEEFGDAGEAMGEAEGNLGEGQSGPAVGDQGRAIEALRQGAQNMMEQMMQAMQGQGQGQQPGMMPGQQPGQAQEGQGPGRFTRGYGGTRGDRDPLGRPRANSGPQFGDEIEVPDEIDTQRARRILDAIRKRLGEQLTPRMEREYLERLLDLR